MSDSIKFTNYTDGLEAVVTSTGNQYGYRVTMRDTDADAEVDVIFRQTREAAIACAKAFTEVL